MQTKSPSISSFATKLLSLIRPACDDTKISAATLLNNGTVPPIAALAVLISKARTTLRLFGLFPLYAWLRSLASGPKAGTDVVLHRIAMLQASSYFSYQALENISLLADSGVIGPRFISTLNRGDSKTARLYLYAYRCWLGGVSCDFLRLMREWQLESRRRVTRKQMVADGRLKWATHNARTFNFKLPSETPSGEYLLRAEGLALHAAHKPDNYQFYIACAQINVVGSGVGVLGPTIKFPGGYQWNSTGVLIPEFWSRITNYTAAGPTLWPEGTMEAHVLDGTKKTGAD